MNHFSLHTLYKSNVEAIENQVKFNVGIQYALVGYNFLVFS
jgi:hypothetical protein